MKQNIRIKSSGFTLVELLVVITILAVISVVAYTSFGWVTDKAKNSSKLDHLTSIEGGLNMFYSQNNYYPMPSAYSATNLWGYNSALAANINNTLTITKNGDAIIDPVAGSGGGIVYQSGTTTQIGAKGVIDSSVLGKSFLSQELYDPALKDVKVGDAKTMKDYGVGKYVYGIYAKNLGGTWNTNGKKWTAYNLAATLSDEQKGYVTKITGNFDNSTCVNCPKTLIGSGTSNTNLTPDESSATGSYTDINNRTAYPISF